MGNEASTILCESPFSFFELPVELQWLILKWYVPFWQKVTVLGSMQEFACLLDPDCPCWPLGTETFYMLLPTLCALSPGLYIASNEAFPDHGYYVQMKREHHLIFTCCSFRYPQPDSFQIIKTKKVKWKESAMSVRNFIRFFLSLYVLAKYQSIRAYAHGGHRFLINTSRKLMQWDNRIVHELREEGEVFLEEDGLVVRVENEKDVTVRQMKGETVRLRGECLESLIISFGTQKTGVYRGNKVFKYCFDITGEIELAGSAGLYNPKAYRLMQYFVFLWFKKVKL